MARRSTARQNDSEEPLLLKIFVCVTVTSAGPTQAATLLDPVVWFTPVSFHTAFTWWGELSPGTCATKLKLCADNVLNVRSKPHVHVRVPVRSAGPQMGPPVHPASDVQTVPALPAAQVATLANSVLLICWKR